MLFTDEQIGLGKIESCASSQALIGTEQDEDYLTDAGVLRNTIRMCKKDLKEVVDLMDTDSDDVVRSCSNFRYQKKFAKEIDVEMS